jgi:hypothetical protein
MNTPNIGAKEINTYLLESLFALYPFRVEAI